MAEAGAAYRNRSPLGGSQSTSIAAARGVVGTERSLQIKVSADNVILHFGRRTRVRQQLRHSFFFALLFWFLLGLTLALEDIFYVSWARTSAFALSSTIFLALFALAWVISHAKENNVRTPMALNVAVVALAFIAVPYYRFRYFGLKEGFRFLGWLVLAFVGVIVALIGLDYFVNGTAAA